jgi:serine protease
VLYVIKALNDAGEGTDYTVASAVALVQEQCTSSPNAPAVLTMSLSGPQSSTLDAALASLQSACHILIVVAAGNDNDNACNYSPSDFSDALVVGATILNDARAYYSNYGTCVSVYAPGGDAGSNPITCASNTGNTATQGESGTSMSTPVVAGVGAVLINQRMATGYQLGSQNVGLLTRQEIIDHKCSSGVVYAYFNGTTSALALSPPPAPAPPPRENGDEHDAAPPPPVTPPAAGFALQHGLLSFLLFAWWLWL